MRGECYVRNFFMKRERNMIITTVVLNIKVIFCLYKKEDIFLMKAFQSVFGRTILIINYAIYFLCN